MINKKLLFLLFLLACEKDPDGKSIFSSDELLSYESEQHIQVFEPKVSSNNKLDILLVIDNSGSMADPQQKLATNLEPLLEYIGDSDWQIAITSSDTLDGTIKIIDKDKKEEFYNAVNGVGIKGIGDEAVLWKAIQALKGNQLPNNDLGLEDTQAHPNWVDCMNRNPTICPYFPAKNQWQHFENTDRGCLCRVMHKPSTEINHCQKRERWLRDGSTLAILLVTDEDHQCHDRVFGCTINDFYFYLKSIREPHATARVYGLLSYATSGNGIVPGNKRFINWRDPSGEPLFEHLASIDDQDYTETLRKISEIIALSIKNSFTLEQAYDDKGETSVTFIKSDGTRDDLAKGQYSIKGKTLDIIKTIPDDIEKIEVTYSYGK